MRLSRIARYRDRCRSTGHARCSHPRRGRPPIAPAGLSSCCCCSLGCKWRSWRLQEQDCRATPVCATEQGRLVAARITPQQIARPSWAGPAIPSTVNASALRLPCRPTADTALMTNAIFGGTMRPLSRRVSFNSHICWINLTETSPEERFAGGVTGSDAPRGSDAAPPGHRTSPDVAHRRAPVRRRGFAAFHAPQGARSSDVAFRCRAARPTSCDRNPEGPRRTAIRCRSSGVERGHVERGRLGTIAPIPTAYANLRLCALTYSGPLLTPERHLCPIRTTLSFSQGSTTEPH